MGNRLNKNLGIINFEAGAGVDTEQAFQVPSNTIAFKNYVLQN